LLSEIAEGSGKPACSLSLLSDQERVQIVGEWNQIGRLYSEHRRIEEYFERQVESRPEAVAVIYEDQQLSYREVNARANRLAHYMRRLGVGPERRVAICVERSPELMVGILAVLKAGAAYVPLDPAYPVERLSYMLEDSAPPVVLTEAGAQARILQALAGATE